jgi:hypothetical protein
MLFLVVSTPRPERPSELAETRQSFWPWIARYEARGICRQSYARVGRGAVVVFDVEDNCIWSIASATLERASFTMW